MVGAGTVKRSCRRCNFPIALCDDDGNVDGRGRGGTDDDEEDDEDACGGEEEEGERKGAPIRFGHSSFQCGTLHCPTDEEKKRTGEGQGEDERGGSRGEEKKVDGGGGGGGGGRGRAVEECNAPVLFIGGRTVGEDDTNKHEEEEEEGEAMAGFPS